MPGHAPIWRRRLGAAALGLLATCTMLACPALLGAEQRQQSRAELEAVTAAIADIEGWLETANASYSREEQNLRDAELRLSTVSRDIGLLEQALAETRASLTDLQTERTALAAEKARQAELLAEVLRAAYMAGDQSLLKLLLNQENLQQSARMLHYYRNLSESRLEALQSFQTTLDALNAINLDLEQKSQTLTNQQRDLQEELATREQALEHRQLTLATLQASIRERGAELDNLQASQQQLQELIEQIDQALERMPVNVEYTPFAERRGNLPRPVSGSIGTAFGSRYGDGNLRRQGISFVAEPGTPVLAIHPGRVVFADWLRGAGLLVILDHGDGYMSLYGNNEALARAPGDWVNAGEVLATSGAGGDDATPGLYFEIRHHGAPENPAAWLATPD